MRTEVYISIHFLSNSQEVSGFIYVAHSVDTKRTNRTQQKKSSKKST